MPTGQSPRGIFPSPTEMIFQCQRQLKSANCSQLQAPSGDWQTEESSVYFALTEPPVGPTISQPLPAFGVAHFPEAAYDWKRGTVLCTVPSAGTAWRAAATRQNPRLHRGISKLLWHCRLPSEQNRPTRSRQPRCDLQADCDAQSVPSDRALTPRQPCVSMCLPVFVQCSELGLCVSVPSLKWIGESAGSCL